MKRGWIFCGVIILLAMIFLMPCKLIEFFLGNVWLGVIVGILSVIVFFILIVPSQILAPQNMFFTAVSEGNAVFIIRGRRIEKVLMEWKDHQLDRQWNVVDGEPPSRGFWSRHFGITFYGLWPWCDVLVYKFRWTGVTENGNLQHKHQWLNYMIVKDDVYWMKLEKAESKDKLHLDVEFFLTIKVMNPYKAKYRVQNWLEAVINKTQGPIRGYIANVSYEEFLKGKQGQREAEMEILKALEDAELVTPEENFKKGKLGKKSFENQYGVRIKAIQIRSIEPPKEYRERTLKEYSAEMEKKAIETIAEAEAKKIRTLAQAEADRIEIVFNKIKETGEVGTIIRSLEAVEKSPLAASVAIQAIPGLPELLRGVFGKRADEANKEDIREIRKMLQELTKTNEKPKKHKKLKKKVKKESKSKKKRTN